MDQPSVERNIGLMGLLIIVVISFGGLAEIVPLLFAKEVNTPVEGMQPWEPLAFEGRDVYMSSGCTVCHTQMIRPLVAETERYGHYSVAGESVWDHPFLFGSKRTGPDLARVGGRYSDDWHRIHLMNPRDVVPESNMPSFAWLADSVLDGNDIERKLRVFKWYGLPYTDEQIAGAKDAVAGHTELEALIAYLQQLGTVLKSTR